MKVFQNPTSLVFDTISSGGPLEIPDVVAMSGHKGSSDYLSYKLFIEGLRSKVAMVEIRGEVDSSLQQELLKLLEGELRRLNELKLKLWNLHRSDSHIQSVIQSQSAKSTRIYDTSEF